MSARSLTISIIGFWTGFVAPLRGLALLSRHPALLRRAALPFLIGVVVIVGGVAQIPLLTSMLGGGLEQTFRWLGLTGAGFVFESLRWIIRLAAYGSGFVALAYLLFLFTRVLAAPFYGLLAERTLIELSVLEDKPFALGPWVRVSARMVGVSVLRALLFGLVAVVLFALSFIPGLAIFTGAIFLLMAAFDIADYAFEAQQLSLRSRMSYFRRHLAVFFGLGSFAGLAFLVPGLNFFLLPASIVGACDMVRRVSSHERLNGKHGKEFETNSSEAGHGA